MESAVGGLPPLGRSRAGGILGRHAAVQAPASCYLGLFLGRGTGLHGPALHVTSWIAFSCRASIFVSVVRVGVGHTMVPPMHGLRACLSCLQFRLFCCHFARSAVSCEVCPSFCLAAPEEV